MHGGAELNKSELALYLIAMAFFLPTLYLIFRNCPKGSVVCFPSLYTTREMQNALFNSFSIAFLVVVVDVLFGVPIAWILARYKLRSKRYLNFLLDIGLFLNVLGSFGSSTGLPQLFSLCLLARIRMAASLGLMLGFLGRHYEIIVLP